MVVLTAEQVAQVIAAWREAEEARLYEVAVSTGLRLGELLGLRWSDIDFDNDRLTVQRAAKYVGGAVTLGPPKTARSRRAIALASATLTTLRQHRASQAERRLLLGQVYTDQDLVFPRIDGHLESPSNVSHRFRNLVKRLGFDRIRFHDLRHTMATLAMAEGVPLKVVSERLGHATTQITADLYSHVLPDMQQDAADALDRALERGRARAAGTASLRMLGPDGPNMIPIAELPDPCRTVAG